MKIIKLLYRKYFLSLFLCVISVLTIFFIFSLIGNLNENYKFLVILKISVLNALQILVYVPSFIYLLSIVLLSIFLRSKNEIIVIKSYFSLRLLTIFILPIILVFTFFETSKNQLNLLIEDYKMHLIDDDKQSNIKIFIKKIGNTKNYIVLKNFGQNDDNVSEYRSYYLTNDIIETAEFSNNVSNEKDLFFIEKFTQYKNNFIKDINNSKMIEIDYLDVIQNSSIVINISKKNYMKFDIKFINFIIFFIFFFTSLFLYFFNSKFANTKQSLKNPILISLIILIYSFFVFNNSLSFYRQEFEIMASVIVGMFFIKVYLNE